jgi:hemerythrin-like domain-containing protein
MSQTIRIIQKEHRLITAVVEGIAHVGRAIGEGRLAPDFALLHAMVDYIDAFPERLHHPKEDRFLFRAIELRTGEGAAQLAVLRDEHAKSYPALERLKAALAELEQGVEGAAARFADLAAVYAAFHWQHMRKEEEVVIPLAQRVLTESDWKDVDAAFAENVELSEAGETGRRLRALFRDIANLTPAPYGLGGAAPPPRG